MVKGKPCFPVAFLGFYLVPGPSGHVSSVPCLHTSWPTWSPQGKTTVCPAHTTHLTLPSVALSFGLVPFPLIFLTVLMNFVFVYHKIL